jgi:hypothetical protein
MDRLFTQPDTWTGGAYELALELGDTSNDRLRAALFALWTQPTLDGCYLELSAEPWEQQRIAPTPDLALDGWLCGVAQLPNGVHVACRSCTVRETDGADWLYFGVPMGALGRAYPVGAYPFDDGLPLDWREPMNEWLRHVGEQIFLSVPFRLGLVGWVVGGEIDSTTVRATGVPLERYEGYLWPQGQELLWYPPSTGSSMKIG